MLLFASSRSLFRGDSTASLLDRLIIRRFTGLPHQIAVSPTHPAIQYGVLNRDSKALVGTGMGAGTLADWIITVSLVVLLRRKKTNFNQWVVSWLAFATRILTIVHADAASKRS